MLNGRLNPGTTAPCNCGAMNTSPSMQMRALPTQSAVGGSLLPACGDSGCRRREVAHPNQIVGGECQSEYPVDSQESAVTGFAQPGDGLEPTKDFFHTFALLLTNRVARMTSGTIIDDAGQLARNMGS